MIQKGLPRPVTLEITVENDGNPVAHQVSDFVISSEYLAIAHIPECSGCRILGGVGPAPKLNVNIMYWSN